MELWNVDELPTVDDALPPALAPALRCAVAEVIQRFLPPSGRLLHLAADTGAVAAVLARRFQGWRWQPIASDAARLRSIQAWRARVATPNLQAPWVAQAPWQESPHAQCVDAILLGPLAVADWPTTAAIAHRVLAPGGLCICLTNRSFTDAPFTSDDRWTLVHSVEVAEGGGVAVLEGCVV